jgi:hypothetical protein
MDRLRNLCAKQIVSIGIAALTFHQLLRWYHSAALAARLKGRKKIDLLDSEIFPVIMMSPATSTITFFSGSPISTTIHLENRVAEIVKVNPWLLSVLDHDPKTGRVAAFYPESVDDESCRSVLCYVKSSDILQGISYDRMVQSLQPLLCKTSSEALGTGAPLFSVTVVVPDDNGMDTKSYAVVVSASHSLVDGHGFYKVHNMLSFDAKVEPLSPGRKDHVPKKILESMGGEPSLMASCPSGFLARFILGQMHAAIFPQTKHLCFEVSHDWLIECKRYTAAENLAAVPWVSSNDCMVSTFLNCLRPDCAMMAMNFRDKIDDCGEDDVGNYEDLLTYMKGDYENPSLIRKSVGESRPWSRDSKWFYRRASESKMLSNLQHAFGATYGATTNWSTFSHPLVMGSSMGAAGGAWGKEELHLPLFDWAKACPACIFGSMVLFRPAEGRGLAAMVAGKQKLLDAVLESGMVGQILQMPGGGPI